MPDLSCYGCGADWKERWTSDDLCPVSIDGDPYHVCPECYGELPWGGGEARIRFEPAPSPPDISIPVEALRQIPLPPLRPKP